LVNLVKKLQFTWQESYQGFVISNAITIKKSIYMNKAMRVGCDAQSEKDEDALPALGAGRIQLVRLEGEGRFQQYLEVSTIVHCCKRHEVYFTTLTTQL